MIRTIIADDEVLVRMGLRTMINWEDYGYEIIAEAGDGEKVLDLCAHNQVDLVITDIKMPKLDGIQLIHALQERAPKVKIIVLSCYKNSEYIKEAMKYNGALDYIFKLELNKDELVQTLEKTKKLVSGSSEQAIDKNAPNEKEQFIKHLLSGEQGLNTAYPMQIDCNAPFVCISIGVIGSPQKANTPISAQSDKLQGLKMWIINTLDNGEFTYDLLEFRQKYYIYLNMQGKMLQQAEDACMKIINTAQLYWGFAVGIGISAAAKELSGFVTTYYQADEAFDFFFILQKSGIVNFSNYKTSKQQLKIMSESEIHTALVERDLTRISEKVEGYFLALAEEGTYKPSEKVKEECFVLLSLLISRVDDSFESFHVPKEKDCFMKAVLESSCLTELKEIVCSQIKQLEGEINHQNIVQVNPEIQKALRFIQNHYRQEISLKDVAAYVGMNESYFSHLFKKAIQKNFITYLNEFRIEKAKDLIQSSDVSLNLISEKVGYSNYAYFSKVFKSVTGINAADYRSLINLKIIQVD